MLDLGVFGLEVENYIALFEISTLSKKMKMPKFGSKDALFGYLWARF